jgi:hypothetical protein
MPGGGIRCWRTQAAGPLLDHGPVVLCREALWSDEVKSEGTSKVTWEIEPVADSVTVTHSDLREGANDELYGGCRCSSPA